MTWPLPLDPSHELNKRCAVPKQFLEALSMVLLLSVSAACDDGAESNECGTTEPEEGTDGTVPQDPKSKEIVDVCGAFCDKLIANGSCYDSADKCPLVREDCVDDCRLQSCRVCPGKLAPFMQCLVDNYDAAPFTCADAGFTCETLACKDQRFDLGACGG